MLSYLSRRKGRLTGTDTSFSYPLTFNQVSCQLSRTTQRYCIRTYGAAPLCRTSVRHEVGCACASLSASVCELNTDQLSLGVSKFDYPSQRSDLRVFPKTRIFWSDTSFSNDSGGFHKGHSGTSRDDPAKVSKMPISMMSVFGGILAHRRELLHSVS